MIFTPDLSPLPPGMLPSVLHEETDAKNRASKYQQITARICRVLLSFGAAFAVCCFGARVLLDHWR